MSGRICVFCDSPPPLTKEHVYPKWLRRAMNLRGPLTLSADHGTDRTVPVLDIQVRAVCARCNNGWMHDLESAVRPVMNHAFHRLPLILGPGSQKALATWAVKTWLLAEIAHARTRQAALMSPDVLHYLYAEREPPPEMTIRLGAVDSEHTQVTSLSSGPIWGIDKEIPVGALAVLTIGDLVFHLYTPVWREGETPQKLMLGTTFAPYLTQIWPHEIDKVEWPPTSILPLSGLERLLPKGRIGGEPPS